MDHRYCRYLMSLFGGLMLLPVQAAPLPDANETTEGLDQIVVTANKQEQQINKVPASVAAYSQQQMDVLGLRTAADVAAQTPGFDYSVTPNPTGGGSSSGGSALISIRGVSSLTGDATTGIYIDDTAIQVRNTLNGTSGSSFPRVFDLERVEVDRGPQGTLFGAAAEGGAVRFITPQPSIKDFSVYARSEVSGTVDGQPSYEAGAAVGGPLVENVVGFRLSAWYREDGGHINHDNYQTGSSTPNDNRQGTEVVRAAFTIVPIEGLKLTPSVYYQYIHSNDTSVYWPSLSDAGKGDFVNGNATRLPLTDRYTLPSLKVEADLGFATLTSVTSYFSRTDLATADETNFEYLGAGLGIAFPTIPNGNANSQLLNSTIQQNLTQELRLQNVDPTSRINWLVGFFYSDSKQHDREYDQNPYFNQVLSQTGLTSVGYLGENPLNGITTYTGDETSKVYQAALFGSADYKITDALTFTAGLRVARSRFSYNLFADGPLDGGPSYQTGIQKQTPITPKFNLAWQVDPNNLLYAAIAKGYRIGGVNAPLPQVPCQSDLQSLGLTAGPQTYQSDSLWSYELGTKNLFADRNIQVEASVFHIDWNQIQQKVVLPSCAFAFTENAGNVSGNGFDVNLRARVAQHWLFSLAAGYTDMKHDNTLIAGNKVVVESGDTLGQTPFSTSTSVQYDFTIGDHASYARLQDIFHSHNGGPYTYQHAAAYNYDPSVYPDPSTNLMNVRVGTQLASFDVSLFVNNLLNAHPQLGYTHATTTAPVYYATTLQPLSTGITVTYRN